MLHEPNSDPRWPLLHRNRRGVLYGGMTRHPSGTKWSWALAADISSLADSREAGGVGSVVNASVAQEAIMTHAAADARRIRDATVASSGGSWNAVRDRRSAELSDLSAFDRYLSRRPRISRLEAELSGLARWWMGSYTRACQWCRPWPTSACHLAGRERVTSGRVAESQQVRLPDSSRQCNLWSVPDRRCTWTRPAVRPHVPLRADNRSMQVRL